MASWVYTNDLTTSLNFIDLDLLHYSIPAHVGILLLGPEEVQCYLLCMLLVLCSDSVAPAIGLRFGAGIKFIGWLTVENHYQVFGFRAHGGFL